MKINIPEEVFLKLKQLQEKVKEEYSKEKYQAKPYITLIQSEKYMPCWEEQSDKLMFVSPNYDFTEYSAEELMEKYLLEMLDIEHEVKNIDTVEEELNMEGLLDNFEFWRVQEGFYEVPVAKTEFFEYWYSITRESANEFIKGRGYNLTGENSHSYVVCPNGDLNELLELFLKIEFKEEN